jgi:hypothetical protein
VSVNQEKYKQNTEGESVDYQISNFRLSLRYFMLMILIALNYSLIMSTLEQHKLRPRLDLVTDILSFLLVLFFDATILLPTIFQVSSISINPNGVKLKTLLWKSALRWEDIVWFGKPAALNFAIIRGKKSIYLLSKRDFVNLEDITRMIMLRWENHRK